MQETSEFNPAGYRKEPMTFSRRKANVLLIPLLLILVVCFVVPFFWIWSGHLKGQINDINFWTFESSLFVGIAVHEFIHGIVAAIYAKNGFRSVKLGVKWKILTPYCHCKEALKLKHYILVAIMPCVVLGIIPLVFGLVIGNIWLFFFGFALIICAGRDLYVAKCLWKEDWESWVVDDPNELGCHLYRPG
jgi:Putative zincin peptidase